MEKGKPLKTKGRGKEHAVLCSLRILLCVKELRRAARRHENESRMSDEWNLFAWRLGKNGKSRK